MGFINEMKANWSKAGAAGVIQEFFENEKKKGYLPEGLSPHYMANKLVDTTWEAYIGESKSPPNRLALIAISMASAVLAMEQSGQEDLKQVCLFGLASILKELAASSHTLKLDLRDSSLIQMASEIFLEHSGSTNQAGEKIFNAAYPNHPT